MAEDTPLYDILRELGLVFHTDFDAKTIRDRSMRVMSKRGLRVIVERRDLSILTKLHVSLVSDPVGTVIAAVVSLAGADQMVGFFQVLLDHEGRPVAERPLTFSGDLARKRTKPGIVPNGANEPKSKPKARPYAPPRTRAPGGVLWVKASALLCRAVAAWLVEQDRVNDDEVAGVLEVLSVHEDSSGSVLLSFDAPEVAGRLALELMIYESDAPDGDSMTQSITRLGSRIARALADFQYSPDLSNEESAQGVDATTTREGQMAPATKRAGKTAGKTASKSQGKGKARAKEVEQEEETSERRRITEEIAQQAMEMREEGATWVEVEEETGFNGAQLRPHIARLSGAKIPGLKKSAQSVARAREDGHAWYAIATSLGITVAEAKEMAEEGGADVEGRIYRGGSDEDEDEGDEEQEETPARKRGSAKKGSAKASTAGKRRSRKADPSEED